jgi:hypothetical protein
MVTVETKGVCPKCGVLLTRATGVDRSASPKKGDLSICIECGAALTFINDELEVRALSDAELNALPDKALVELAYLRGMLHVWRWGLKGI